ncbi:LamG-like jellyroll fold domain-containing protein [Micromonospora olivasterospora]|uniref:RHS repeat-associated protein n=1 Tax=Micromonospora olivasterospora TaxID=1880 RepID=A0A562I2K0_MICOL|nr:LamG-like jellyroll fold domain-containing protein [Micromonospora olivasterospora]TWH65271.1 RHS repeat-associated protein [Micromonospora olivasterospora]
MRRSVTSSLRRSAIVVAAVFALTVAVPSGVVRPGGEFPLTWLSWFVQRPAWSATAAFLGLPVQQKGRPTTIDHHVPASATDARQGAGRAPKPAAGTLESYQPHQVEVTPESTGPAEQGFNSRTSTRLAARSSARSDVYANADGSYTKRTYNRPVNYRASDGTWKKIDSDLARWADGRLHVKANGLGVSVAGTTARAATNRTATADAGGTASGDLAQLTLPTGESVGYQLQGATVSAPVVDGPTARYHDILPQTDLELTTFDAGIKETLILRSPQAASTWVFPLRLDGLTPRLTTRGSVELLDADGKAVAWFPHGSMQDSNVHPQSGAPAESDGVAMELITVDGAPALKVTADQAWLNDPARVYPVRVDPTVTTGTTGDVYVDNDPDTTNHNGDNLPVGTYNGGTVKARSFIHFDEFDDDGLLGKRFSAATLKLYLTWTYDCTSHKPFYVHRTTQAWTVADLTTGNYPGPTISSSIGSLTVGDNYPACQNDNPVNRSVGKWVSVPLDVATFNDWSTGGMNEGLALTASETDSTAWKRFTAANYGAGAYKPYIEFTYTNNVAPQVNLRYPANNTLVQTLTPELLSRAVDSDNWPAKGLTYSYVVKDAETGAQKASSGWITTPSWTVPAGKLDWNKTYVYTVQVYDKATYSPVSPGYAFTTSVPQPLLTANLAQNSGKGYDASIGNYTTSATDASVPTVGPSLSVTRSYNSLDTRRGNAFGTGWSSLLDMRATQVKDVAGSVQSVLVTYPTGQDVAFGRKNDGTFTAPSGRFSTFVETKDTAGAVTGYTLTDKDATVYTFGRSAGGGVFKVTRIADASGRALTVAYDTSGYASRLTSASGRYLDVTWSTPSGSTVPHVATVSTNPAVAGNATTAETWSYSYGANDQIAKVCPPTSAVACTTYQADTTSQYANALVNAGPYSYWPLNEASGASIAASRVLTNAGVDNARYTNVTLGQPAALAGSTATTATFNGTSSYVQLPGKLVADGQYQSISMWFKTTTPNGVLFSYSADAISKGTTAGNYNPALYIGSDGKLRGEFWQGSATPITSNAAVTDGAWHHVVLTGAGDTQTLYLDGVAKGTLPGTIALIPNGSTNVLVGAGFVGHAWPSHLRSGASPAVASYFSGSISDVAFFNQALTGTTVAALNSAGRTSHPVLSKVVRPSGGVTAEITYDKATGRVATVKDENGGTWSLGTPTVSGDSGVYAASVLGAKPADYWRLGSVDVTDAVNEVEGGTATFNNTTLGVAGPFSDSKAASFNGSTSYLQLPPEDLPTTGPNSVEMWFKMPDKNTAGGVLYSYQNGPITDPAAVTSWNPSLYVGTDGKLRGGFWTGSGSSGRMITTAGTVNDGKWHHVTLSAGTATQSLYLDGVAVGKLDYTLAATSSVHAYVGAGKWSGAWPMHGTPEVGYFPGSIAEVAFYRSQLSADQVSSHFQASKQTVPVAVTMVSGQTQAIPMPVQTVTVTGPTGEKLSYSYDLVNGNRMVAQTDGLGNTTKLGYDVGGFGNLTYDPNGVWTQELQDARGNTKQVITCQDQSANKCSSVYYTYYPDATSTTLSPDARNDLMLTMRDGRSASETDNTYLTTYGYDTKGNQTTITDPLGRVTRTTYTDGTTIAAKDGGFAPAGLPSTVTTPGGQTQQVVYYASGDVAEVVEPGGKITRYAYDGLGRPVSETEITNTFPAGLTTTRTFDKQGRPLTETEPAVTNRVTGAVHTAYTETTYDVDGNLTEQKVSDLTGGDAPRTEKHGYNAYGQETSTTNAADQTTTFEYNPYGQVARETEADGGVTVNTYDVEGNLLTSKLVGFVGDPNTPSAARDLVTTQRSYDPAGRLASETDAMGWTTSHTYTDNGLEAKITRTDGTRTFVVKETTYDAAGNEVTEKTNNGRSTTATTYDAAGRTISTTVDPNGLKRTTTLTYDADDNVVSSVSSGPNGTTGISEALYDTAGRAIAETTYPSTKLTPVARWKLNETTGTTAADSAGNSPATANNVTWSSDRGGSAVSNGSTTKIQTAGPVVDTKRSLTFAAWVNLASTGLIGRVLGQDGVSQNAFELRYQKTNQWMFVLKSADVDDPPNNQIVTSTSVPSVNTWTHLAGVFDATTGTMTLYVNGVAEATKTGVSPWSATGPFTIGCGRFNGVCSDSFNGKISDVQAYQKALSAAEIGQLKAGSAPAADAQVIRTSQVLDQDGLPTSITDENGNTTYQGYDEEGRLVKTTAPAAMVEQAGQLPALTSAVSWVGYNTFDEPTDARDANGNWSVTRYDAAGRVVSQTDPSYTPPGSSTPIVPETTQTYDEAGQVTSVTDPLGKITRYEYDQLGRVSKQVAPNDGVTTYRYDDVGNVLSTTDPTGAVTEATYDYLGRTLTSTEVVRQASTNYTTTYTYDDTSAQQTTQVTSAAGVNSTTTYNAAGEPLTVKDGANNVTSYTYDSEGRTTRTTRPDGSYATVTYDMADRATDTAEYSPAGVKLSSQSAHYDRAGNMVATTDARDTTTTFEFDATGALTREIQPISGSDAIETTFGYDLEGNRTRFTDGRGNAFYTTYNSWGLPESQIEPATAAHPDAADRTFTIAYDRGGRPVTQTMPGGVTVTRAYDDMGQLIRQAGAGAEAATVDRVFGYDVAGRMTEFSGSGGTNTISYDDRGLPLSVTGPSGDSSFGYDPDGRLASRQDAAGTTSYGYDGAGRLYTLSNPTADVQMAYTYNTLSQLSKITYGNNGNSRNFTYDPLRRLKDDELKSSTGTSLAKISYSWDENSNIVSKSTTGFAGSAANTYTYDLADRLTSWNNGTATTVYAYDKSGNRVQNGSKLFTYDQRNRLLTADGAGYTYTARGTLASAGGVTTSTDAFGQVVSQQSTGGGSQTYSYDGLGRAIRPGFSYGGLANDLAGDASASYVRGPSGEVVGTASGGSQRLVWTDLHTDVVGQFTATGAGLSGSMTYDPLGKIVGTAGLLGQLGYQSEWTDAVTSRVNMHARWYNTETGQFDTRDTASNSPVPDSINANRYQYGDANPLTVTDPTGHWGFGSLKKAFSSAVSSVRSTVSSYASSAYSYASSYAYSAYSSAKSTVTKTVSKAKAVVKKKVQQVKRKYNQVKKTVKKTYNKVKKAVKKKIDAGRKYVSKKIAAAKKRAKQLAAKAKQAAKKVAAKAVRVVKKAASQVKDAAAATKKWVQEHKDTLLEVAAIGGAILAGIACTAVTAGAGAIACMVGAGALINLAKDAAQGDIHSVGDALGSVGTGAVSGLVGGAGGAIAGRVGALVANKVGTGLAGRLATEAAENTVEDAIGQVATTGRYNPRAAAESMVPGLSLLSRKGGGARSAGASSGGGAGGGGNAFGISVGGGGATCPRHSFDPKTRVLMADGSSRPIEDVNVGDKVMATEPTTGRSEPKQVTQLHRNDDKDLTDLTVRDQDGKVTKVETTWHHPFWNATKRKWDDAKDLKPGTKLLVRGKGAVTVAAVLNKLGAEEMRDLTVADIHTYYVVAGNTPVLVHNCNLANYADSVRNKPGAKFASEYTSPSGAKYYGHNRHGQQAEGPLADALERAGHHGGCAEVHCLIQAQAAEGPDAIRGGTMRTVQTRNNSMPTSNTTGHGEPAYPCGRCSRLLEDLGIG